MHLVPGKRSAEKERLQRLCQNECIIRVSLQSYQLRLCLVFCYKQ
jgi:hypothetical protein